MLDVELLSRIEHMLPTGFLLTALAGKTVGELAAVFGEQFADLAWAANPALARKSAMLLSV
jgi:hypothetical protein